MSLSTLQDLLPEIQRLGAREAILFDNGFRVWRMSYGEIWAQTAGLVRELAERGLAKGDRVAFWSENRPEWVIAFWACVAACLQIVPVDSRSSPRLLERICREVDARLIILGETTAGPDLPAPSLSVLEIAALSPDSRLEITPADPEDIVQIVYTSGTTGEPRGVVHRHRNICSNLDPFQREIRRYRGWARPFQPVRILDLLPLSHMFGQSLGLFIPLLFEGSAAFAHDLRPAATIQLIRRQRISVLAAVPRMARNLQSELERRFGLSDIPLLGRGWTGAARRWWRFRRVHRLLGPKFWALVVGGAAVAPELEAFWKKLGFAVVQGYGLTESSPVIAVNHPLDTRQGSIGKAVEGQTVRLAPDGEILVRGESVADEYLGPGARAQKLAEDGWLHTGDIGEMDEEGRIYYKGRKKDVIVGSSGLNVYPQDVEAELNRLPGVRESVVVGRRVGDEEIVHAALLLDEEAAEPAALAAQANQRLEAHQRIQSWSLWPQPDFPRTPSTLKVKRREVATVVNRDTEAPADAEETGGDVVEAIVSSLARRPVSEDGVRLAEDLGLSSLDRVELLSRLEERQGVHLDEELFSQLATLGEIRQAVQAAARQPTPAAAEHLDEDRMPRWGQSPPVRWLRAAALTGVLLPAYRILITLTAEGIEQLEGVHPPVIFAANHNSHFDVPSIMAALPWSWRGRLAPAVRQEYYLAHFRPAGHTLRFRLRTSLKYFLSCGLFGAYPLPQRMGGVRETLHYTGELAAKGICPVVFPEGKRSSDGRLQPFQPGIGLMAVRLRIPVVPVHLQGAFEAWSKFERWPQGYAKIHVKFGPALRFESILDPAEAAGAVEQAIRRLA